MRLFVKRDKFGFQYKEEGMTSSGWKSLPSNITDAEGIRRYFEEGKHQMMPGRYDTPQILQFVDDNMKPYQHFKLRSGDYFIEAVENYDQKKKLLFNPLEVWTPTERLIYLRQTSVHLPTDIEDLKEALTYLTENEPFTVDEYSQELSRKTDAAIRERLMQHAAKDGQIAVIE